MTHRPREVAKSRCLAIFLVGWLTAATVLAGTAVAGATPAPQILLTVPKEASGGSRVSASGTVRNAPSGSRVEIQKRSASGKWQRLGSTPIRNRKFKASFTYPAGLATLSVRAALVFEGSAVTVSAVKQIHRTAPEDASPPAPPPPVLPPPTEPMPPVELPPAATSSYWGAWIGSQFTGAEAPWDMNAVTDFEAATDKSVSLVEFSSPFAECSGSTCTKDPFPTTPFNNIRSHGAIPVFSWASDSTPSSLNEPEFQLADIIAGTYDAYIREWATAAKGWGHPFFLRFDWEMNGSWFPWSEGVNGNEPGEYVAAWRHVHDIFREVGATNVSWVWCPYVDPNATLQNLEALYPGNEYVDWTGLDGYNWGPSATPARKWRSFSFLFGPSYHRITETVAPSKPMLVGETASSEVGGSKAEWIQEMFKALPTEFPRIQGLIWFDKLEEGMDWPLESSEGATQAFAAGIQDSRFLGDTLGGLTASPIPAP